MVSLGMKDAASGTEEAPTAFLQTCDLKTPQPAEHVPPKSFAVAEIAHLVRPTS